MQRTEKILCAAISGLTVAGALWVMPADAQHASDRGHIDVSGQLHSAVCHMEMASRDQHISLGSITAAALAMPGDTSVAVPLTVRLRNCVRQSGALTDRQHGSMVWSAQGVQVAVKFTGEVSESSHALFAVSGARGVGLRLVTPRGEQIRPGDTARPTMLTADHADLHWYAALERTAGPLQPGPVTAVMNFQLFYY